ncbi:MAG: SDR family NAD(P)-dependent oxidoreductase [Microbacteriaceae bacterium]|nr:SDR family NAD(P)-dependent oxidoreductase [Microbacteriaceae bacterium]
MTLNHTTMVLTGASSGLGREAARELAAQGATIAVVGRNNERTRQVAAEIGGHPFIADFDRLDDVRELAESLLNRFERIDVLANNAGGLIPRRGYTVDGHERTFQSNHLAPFLLTNLLLPRLIESAGRVISTASVANRFGSLRLDNLDSRRGPYLGGWRAYGTSKLETILFIQELARRTEHTALTSYSFHPGFVATNFGNGSTLMRINGMLSRGQYGITAQAGAVPLVRLASDRTVGSPNGTYFDMLTPNGRVNRQAGDPILARQLWQRSTELVGLLPVG